MGFFSNICKVILKGVGNTIETGYSITIIKREYSWYNRGYSFKRNQGFDSFSCVLNIISIFFKIFIIISPFTFPHKGRV